MEKSTVETLPPCRVCGAAATGLHYGVISCEACKAFYRRSLARGDVYECPEERSCKISSESRNNCAYCRYQKCIKTGMSKDAIKTGRYSYAMKASTMKEVRGLKTDDPKDSKSNKESCLEKSSHLQSPYNCKTEPTVGNSSIVDNRMAEIARLDMLANIEPHMIFNRQNIVEPRAIKRGTEVISEIVKPFSYDSGINDDSTSIGSNSHSSCIEELMLNSLNFSDQDSECSICNHCKIITNNSVGLCQLCNSDTISCDYMKENNSCRFNGIETDLGNHDPYCFTTEYYPPLLENNVTGAISSCTGNEQKLYDVSKIEIYDRIIEQMHKKHKAIVPEDVRIDTSLSQMEQEYLEMIDLKKKIFGPLEPMSEEEYFNFYEETGLDIDGRRELLLEFLPMVELSIHQHIDFAKSIPGFRDLSVKDQIGLIKGSRMDFFMFGSHRCFNIEHKLYSPLVGKVYHVDDMKKLEGEHLEPTFVMQQRIKKLNLSREETVVLSAYCIMVTDNCDLEDPIRVEYSQDFLLECLFYLFDKQRPPGERGRFIKIVECLTQMRDLREANNKCDEKFFKMWRYNVHIPPLLCEMISTNQ